MWIRAIFAVGAIGYAAYVANKRSGERQAQRRQKKAQETSRWEGEGGAIPTTATPAENDAPKSVGSIAV